MVGIQLFRHASSQVFFSSKRRKEGNNIFASSQACTASRVASAVGSDVGSDAWCWKRCSRIIWYLRDNCKMAHTPALALHCPAQALSSMWWRYLTSGAEEDAGGKELSPLQMRANFGQPEASIFWEYKYLGDVKHRFLFVAVLWSPMAFISFLGVFLSTMKWFTALHASESLLVTVDTSSFCTSSAITIWQKRKVPAL